VIGASTATINPATSRLRIPLNIFFLLPLRFED
jgi:hypothetical protein